VLEIRSVGGSDAAALRDLRLRALGESPRSFASSVAEESAFGEERWTELAAPSAAGDDSTVLVAVHDGAWVGMAAGRWFDRRRGIAQLWGMWVDPAQRRQGVGGRLVAGIRDWAAGHGARFLRLGVIGDVPGLSAFYEDMGFVRSGEERPLARDPDRLAVFLVRPV
jgi:GNAT superfamily N-acetyltransferase